MRIEVDEQLDSLAELKICHDSECLIWDASSYDRAVRGQIPGVFREINSYWSSRPKELQKQIFECYRKIYEAMEDVFDSQRLHQRLTELCKELLDLHPMEDIKYWINTRTDLKVPPSMQESYSPDDPRPRERTYLRDDYFGLMVLSINLRPMIPIWGEYIRRIRDETGANYKEKYAMGLLSRTHLINSEPMRRLSEYMEASVGYENVTMSSVLGGLGSTELPGWLMSLVLVRKVALVDVAKSDDKNNLITNIYRIIRNSIETLNRKFAGNISKKRRAGEVSDDDNSSLIETYKVKQQIPDGDLVALSVFTENVAVMTQKVDPTIDPELVQACLEVMAKQETLVVRQHHLTITQWVMRPAISPRGIPSLNKLALLRTMAVTQAMLAHWGFVDIALLMGASLAPSTDDTVIGMESRARIPRDRVDRLVEIYPHYQQVGGRQATERQTNPACRAIEAISKHITRHDWDINAPDSIKRKSSSVVGRRRLVVPGDIKTQLADLIIHLAEREVERKQAKAAAFSGV